MPIIGIIASSIAKVAKFWSYPTTTVAGSAYERVSLSATATALGGLVSNGTDNDSFVVSYNKSGNINFQFRLNVVAGTDILTGIALDSSENSYISVAGPSNAELFAKFNSSGTQQWAKTTSYTMVPRNIKVDSAGDIYVTGRFISGTTRYQMLMKLSSTPAITWIRGRSVGTSSVQTDNFWDSAIDSGSNVYAAGGTLDGTGADNIAQLYKFNSSGTLQWGRLVGGGSGLADGSVFRGCDVDSSDNIYVAGSRSDNAEAVVMKFNSSGTAQWSRNIGAFANSFTSISVDSSGNVYVASQGPYLLKFNSSGTLQWQRQIKYNTTLNVTINSLDIDEANGIINVAGYIGGGGGYAFFAALPADGSGAGTYTLGIYTVNYSASSLTVNNGSTSTNTSTFTPFTTAPTLSDVTTTKTTTTYTNNKTLI